MMKIVVCQVMVSKAQATKGMTLYFAGIEGGPSHLVSATSEEAALKYGFEYAKLRWGQTEAGKWSAHPGEWAATWPHRAEALARIA